MSDTIPAGHRVTLHLGVVDQAYRSRSKRVGVMTTGDVAEILEAKYGLFSAFARWQEKFILQACERSVQGAIEALVMGHAVDPWGSATQEIQQRFSDYINAGMAERIGLPGVPTQAALHGVSHRLAHPYSRKNPRRPSFRDTGLMVSSFRAWTTTGSGS